jgi:hypothetical protein
VAAELLAGQFLATVLVSTAGLDEPRRNLIGSMEFWLELPLVGHEVSLPPTFERFSVTENLASKTRNLGTQI